MLDEKGLYDFKVPYNAAEAFTIFVQMSDEARLNLNKDCDSAF